MAMVELWRCPAVRLGTAGCLAFLGLMLSSCQDNGSGGLPVTVNSVSGTLEPYNPMLSSHPIPAERVNFTVGNYDFGSRSLACQISVRRSGKLIGSTQVTFGSRAGTPSARGVRESDDVGVNLVNPFNGTPSDAIVSCITEG